MFTRHVLGDTPGSNWLVANNYHELIAVIDAIRDDKKAFKFLINGKHFELAAFVNAIWEDEKAFKFLIETYFQMGGLEVRSASMLAPCIYGLSSAGVGIK